MYEPFAWTLSTIYEIGGQTGLLVGVNDANLLPGLDLSIRVDIRRMGVWPSGRVDGGGLSYQKRSGD